MSAPRENEVKWGIDGEEGRQRSDGFIQIIYNALKSVCHWLDGRNHSETCENMQKYLTLSSSSETNSKSSRSPISSVNSESDFREKIEEVDKFSSLLFISKRLNEEVKEERNFLFHPKLPEFVENAQQVNSEGESQASWKFSDEILSMSIDDLTDYIIKFDNKLQHENSTECDHTEKLSELVRLLHYKVTGRELIPNQNNQIFIRINLNSSADREFITKISKIKLPYIHSIQVVNINECDDDLESFLLSW